METIITLELEKKKKGELTEQANRLCQLGKMLAAHGSHLSDSQRVPNSSCENADMPTHSLPLLELPPLQPPSLPSPKAASVTFSSTTKKAFSFHPKISTHKIKKQILTSQSLPPSLPPPLPLFFSHFLSLLSPQRTTPLPPPPPPPRQFLEFLNILTKIECSSTSEARSISEGFLLTLVF